jgi:hypothetical protein
MRTRLVRVVVQILITALQAILWFWVACAPLVWILRDGLGPDMVESGWAWSIVKFLAQWGFPALVVAASLYGLSSLDRKLASTVQTGDSG